MSLEKISIWISRLSNEGKLAMHSFLVYFNTGKTDEITFELSKKDLEALSVIIQRLQVQNPVSKINSAILQFNKTKSTNIELIKE